MRTIAAGFNGQRYRPGPVSQIFITLFIGIPMTVGLLVAMAFYCTFQFLKFALIARLGTAAPVVPASEENFTASLGNLAKVHGQPVAVSPQSPLTHAGCNADAQHVTKASYTPQPEAKRTSVQTKC